MSLLLLLAALSFAETPAEAVKSLRADTKALSEAKTEKEYAALRLQVLEKTALLQDWVLRVEQPRDAANQPLSTLTPKGRKALGKRKPLRTDFR